MNQADNTMPYIKREDRRRFDTVLYDLPVPDTKGELEYCIFYLMNLYAMHKVFNYTNLHDTVYAAHHCADEFRRRYLDVREDAAREQNGDVII